MQQVNAVARMSGKPPKSSALQKRQREGAQAVCCWKYRKGSQKKRRGEAIFLKS